MTVHPDQPLGSDASRTGPIGAPNRLGRRATEIVERAPQTISRTPLVEHPAYLPKIYIEENERMTKLS